jgi:hypothetical protein
LKHARWLVLIGALLLLLGALLHSYGYKFVAPAMAATNSPPALLAAFKTLWLAFSIQAALLCAVIIWASRLPQGRALVLLCSAIPAAISILMFWFLGAFIGSIMMGLATVFLVVGGFLLPHDKG